MLSDPFVPLEGGAALVAGARRNSERAISDIVLGQWRKASLCVVMGIVLEVVIGISLVHSPSSQPGVPGPAIS